jgi:anti-sigma factor RsiW
MDHLSALTLDALELGSLDAASSQRARDHLATCARCAADLATLRESRARFDATVFARTLPALGRRQARRRWYWLLSAPALAGVAVAVLLAVRPGSDLTAKGGPTCEVFARRGARVFAVKDGSALAPGDEIRFVVRPAGYRHVLVGSVDAAAVATIYAPYSGKQSLSLASPTDRAELPGSIRLDTTAGPERLYCLFSKKPIEAAPVLGWLRKVGTGGPAAVRNPPAAEFPSVVAVSALLEKVVP